MPFIWENYWGRNDKTPQEVIIEDLGDDFALWKKFFENDPQSACALIDERLKEVSIGDLLKKASIDDWIALYEFLSGVKTENEAVDHVRKTTKEKIAVDHVRKTTKEKIMDYLKEDSPPAECERVVKELLEKSLFSVKDLENVPAYGRIIQKQRLEQRLVIAGVVLLGVISVGLFFINFWVGLVFVTANIGAVLGMALCRKKQEAV